MIAENIQSSFFMDLKRDIASFYCENKNSILNIWKKEKHLNLTTVHFKIWNFNGRGSLVNHDKKVTFESDKNGSLLSEMSGDIFLKYNI